MEILKNLSSQELNQLYELGSFFVLNNKLPVGTQFGIDGNFWTTGTKFQGIKLIPPGFHIITTSPNPIPIPNANANVKQCSRREEGSTTDEQPDVSISETFKIGYEVRSGIVRFFQPQEKVIREYDYKNETFKTNEDELPSSSLRGGNEETITSLEYMKSIDSNLAPYPFDRYERWKSITNLITFDQVKRVIGIDHREDGILDSLMSNYVDLFPTPSQATTTVPSSSTSSSGHSTEQPPNRTRCSQTRLHQTPHDSTRSRATFWPVIDLKRSWPKGALGPVRSKWSRDKSWLLNHTMHNHFKSDSKELLGLLQLSFVTFIEIQSVPSFEFYQNLLNLITRSSLTELIKMDDSDEDDKKAKGELEVEGEGGLSRSGKNTARIDYLKMRLEVIIVFREQLKYLRNDFFSESMEDFQIENWFCKILDQLRMDLNLICRMTLNKTETIEGSKQDHRRFGLSLDELEIWLKKIDWEGIQLDCKRFDWNVKSVKFSRPPHGVTQDSDDEDDEEDDDEEDDDDECQPVVV